MKPAVKIYRVIIVLVIIVTASFGVGIPVSLATDSISTFRQTGSNEPSEVTYTKDIAPILNKNCATCHRPGQIAPFSLLTYQDAATHAMEIAWATSSRYMPPWKAAPGYGEFKNPRQLNEQEIALIERWLNEGTPEGNPADLPPTPKFPEGGWQLGLPDLILKVPEPYTVKATGIDQYQCFVLPLNLPNDLYIRAIEIKPGNSKAVHHAVVYQAASDEARRWDAQYPDVGYPCLEVPKSHEGGYGLYTWTPGTSPDYLPDGVVRLIPKGSDIILENHYPPTANEITDRSTVAIYLAKTEPQKLAIEIPFGQPNLSIPPGEPRYKVTAAMTIPIDLQILDIMPHMHLLGREMKVTATLPDGTVKPMIWIKDWDRNWQMEYQYKEPLNLPKGTKLEMVAYFDNSRDNPRNPNDPPKRVTWGMSAKDEMCDFIITLIVPNNQEELKQVNEFYSQVLSEYEAAMRARARRLHAAHNGDPTFAAAKVSDSLQLRTAY
ncbi:monooxygenase [Aerosakkonema funiforme]|uniref:Copper type II ascorbate-dependent monooxygenase C-terminal domain-containing protein n=2 Tax=Oscillatoriophycideae TaxID=1301283 RepID=A0A926VDU5_9CYAN|nr:hypothetical protein [Aerosakkonema funiforme]MBD2182036.1 hypothetical protein [Aerosakkonema funiforme FACHB-1375]